MFAPSDLPILHRMQAIRDRIYQMKHKRACREYGLALGMKDCKALNWCIIHNSLIARSEGKPWREVNYSHMRNAKRILENYEAGRLVDAWYHRKTIRS